MRLRIMCVLLALLASLCVACSLHTDEARTDIAISMCDTDTTRNAAVCADVTAALEGAGFSVSVRDAGHKLSQQIADIEALSAQKPRYLIIVAVKSIGLRNVIKAANEKGIRVLLLDRFSLDAQDGDVLARIGMDADWAGRNCARLLAEQFDGKPASVLELTGEAGASSTNAFAIGFRDELCKHANLRLAGVVRGGFNRVTAQRALLDHIATTGIVDFDAVFGHSDEEAIGTVSAFFALDETVQIPIVCIGGQDDARRALLAGQLSAVVSLPPQYGTAVLELIQKLEAGEDFKKEQLVRGSIYTAENANLMAGY